MDQMMLTQDADRERSNTELELLLTQPGFDRVDATEPPTHRRDKSPMSITANTLIEFAAMDWQSPASGVRVKETTRGDLRVRLVEFSAEFAETNWCQTGHVGFVVDGTLEINFNGRVLVFKTGDGLFIPPGESSQHKTRVPLGKATLFVVENF